MVLAGQIIRALDFAGFASASDTTDVTNFNTTSFVLGSPIVGVSFVAPTSGSVNVFWGGKLRLNSATGVRVFLAAAVRTGGTVGSGTDVAGTDEDWALEVGEAAGARLGASRTRPVTGLTAGSTYNVSLWHKNAISVASAGTFMFRDVTVTGVV